jgi:hypothetical protein
LHFPAAPLDLHGDSNRRPLGSTPQSPVLLSPPAELRGWFQNLFSWKQSYHLRSRESITRTRDELTRLLGALGVGLIGEDIGGCIVLRCIVDDGALLCPPGTPRGPDALAEAKAIKGVSFRTELHASPTDSFLPMTPGTHKRMTATRSVPGTPGECYAVLVQEKGSISTFRAVYHTLGQMWTLGTSSPPVTAIPPVSSAWPQEQAHGQFVF